jgi:hypothetical protein
MEKTTKIIVLGLFYLKNINIVQFYTIGQKKLKFKYITSKIK